VVDEIVRLSGSLKIVSAGFCRCLTSTLAHVNARKSAPLPISRSLAASLTAFRKKFNHRTSPATAPKEKRHEAHPPQFCNDRFINDRQYAVASGLYAFLPTLVGSKPPPHAAAIAELRDTARLRIVALENPARKSTRTNLRRHALRDWSTLSTDRVVLAFFASLACGTAAPPPYLN